MKSDLYTKVVLTVIAVCLTIQLLQKGFFPAVVAQEKKLNNEIPEGYALVPVNSDGSINMVLKQSDEPQDVVIVGWKYLKYGVDLSTTDVISFYNGGLPVSTTGER